MRSGAFLLSCTRINKEPPSRMMLPGAAIAGKAHHWQSVCGIAAKLGRNVAPGSARRFFENWFSAYQVTDRGNPNGLFTGYFEPLLRGSLKKTRRYSVPLYKKPNDLVTVQLGDFKKGLKGQQITGRLRANTLVPYAERAEIESGALSGKGLDFSRNNQIHSKFIFVCGHPHSTCLARPGPKI